MEIIYDRLANLLRSLRQLLTRVVLFQLVHDIPNHLVNFLIDPLIDLVLKRQLYQRIRQIQLPTTSISSRVLLRRASWIRSISLKVRCVIRVTTLISLVEAIEALKLIRIRILVRLWLVILMLFATRLAVDEAMRWTSMAEASRLA